jgi:predicted transcriptional regulator
MQERPVGLCRRTGGPTKGWSGLRAMWGVLICRLELTGVGILLPLRKRGTRVMPDEQPSEFTAKIVAAYVRRNQVPPDQLPSLIATVHQALAGLGKAATEPVVERTPAVSIRRSVHRDHVICLDCGWRGQMLRRHVTTAHGLTVEQYRGRWNLPADHAMTAPGYSERRSAMAKQLGLGRTRGASAETMAVPEQVTETAPPPSPKRRGRPRKPRN